MFGIDFCDGKKNPGTISSFLKDTYTDAATAENTETLGKNSGARSHTWKF